MAHKITLVTFSPASRGEIRTPNARVTIFTDKNREGFDESVHDRIGRFQAETEGVLMHIVDISEVGEPVLDGTGVVAPSYHAMPSAGDLPVVAA